MSNHALLQLVPNRVAAAVERLRAQVWTRESELAVEATTGTAEHLLLQQARDRPRAPVRRGESWGRLYDQRWCRTRPDSLDHLPPGEVRYLEWREQGEVTLYLGGVPHYGFDVAHRYCALPQNVREAWLEAICVQGAIWHPEASGLSSDGSLFEGAFLVRRDEEAWHAYHDLKVLLEMMLAAHPSSAPLNPSGFQPPVDRAAPEFRRLLRMLDDSINAFEREGASALRRHLAAVYREFEDPRPLACAALTGHAHIDLVWLWPERVGEAKTLHTFATADRLMDLYPEMRFVHSQPAAYAAVERRSPGLLERVKARITSGRWEATGVLYVESDTQLPCGEGLARAFTLGQEAFASLRGGPAALVWLPDAFGYSACLPQLMQLCGASFFFTSKLAWSAINRFPLSSFVWRGSDGSEVLAHVLHDVGYNGTVAPGELQRAARAHAQSDVYPEFLMPVGYGDGGGGVTEEMCERARRLGSMRGLPAVNWQLPERFFERLARARAKLPVYAGELYLEFHRGTYTTHSHLKAAFRALERALQVHEASLVATAGEGHLQKAWERLVFTQFHDYIPGSSVTEVYAEGIPELRRLAQEQDTAARAQLEVEGGEPCLFNPHALAFQGLVDGRLVMLPPLSGLRECDAVVSDPAPVRTGTRLLANEHLTLQVDESGGLERLVIAGEALALVPGACSLVLYPDRPAHFEPWDIDRQTLDLGTVVETPATITTELELQGMRGVLSVRRRLGRASSVTQRYVLDSGSRVVRIELVLDWHETETLLKLHLRTGYRGTHVRCGTPFGSILRPQLPGPLTAEAMWEIPASRWIAGTDDSGRRGMFIVTEAKFGFSCRDGDWGVSLVRSPRVTGFEGHAVAYPRALSRLIPASIYADQGEHRISLAIGAYHADAPREQHPAALAEVLFTPPLRYVGRPRTTAFRGLTQGPSLLPCWARPLGEDWILRLHEVGGERGTAALELAPGWRAQPVDLREHPRGGVLADGRIEFRPYEVVSLRVSRVHEDVREGVASSLWSGFHRQDFRVDGRACIVVQPHVALPSRPWIWRTEFFGAFPSVDLALLGMGFHLAYMDVQDMYGAPVALDHMDEFHSCLIRNHSLGKKPVLEGFSRGALFALNWAARRADAVACLYLDAPVCDFRSWPGGRGRGPGSRGDWERLKQAYGFSEEQARASAPTPLDNLRALAAARVPIVAVYGTADEALPPEENVLLLERRYKENGGEIMVIAKENVGHHPHSLADPTAIVDFILSKTL